MSKVVYMDVTINYFTNTNQTALAKTIIESGIVKQIYSTSQVYVLCNEEKKGE